MKWLAPLILLLWTLPARAELTIEITQGMDNPTAIAVVPFAWQGPGTAPEDIAWIVDSDLSRSGQFAPVARNDMLGRPSTEAEVFYRDWRAIDSEYLLIGRASASGTEMRVEYELFDVVRQGKHTHTHTHTHTPASQAPDLNPINFSFVDAWECAMLTH